MGFFTPPFPDYIRAMALLAFVVAVFLAEHRALKRLSLVRDQIGNPNLPKTAKMSSFHSGSVLYRQRRAPGGQQLYDAFMRELHWLNRTNGRILLVTLPVGLLSYL